MGLWANMIKAMKSPLFKEYLKDGDYEVKNAVSAETATNLANTPTISTNNNKISVTAGGKTSDAVTVPFATSAQNADNANNYTNTGGIAAKFRQFEGEIDSLGEDVEDINQKVEVGLPRKKYLYHVYMSVTLSTSSGNKRLTFSFSHLSSQDVDVPPDMNTIFSITDSDMVCGNGYLTSGDNAPVDIFALQILSNSGGYDFTMSSYEGSDYYGTQISDQEMIVKMSKINITEF